MPPKAKVALITLASMALVGAAEGQIANAAGPSSFRVVLTGLEEVGIAAGTAGDLDGTGLVHLTVDPLGQHICYDFTLSGLSTPLMAHIHKAPAMSKGPSVVTLFTGPGADLDNCLIWTRKKLAEIVSDPSSFYVNLATTEFPDGAIRGQLRA